ncbi:hypothetical protein AVEN_176341-1 [Araneus ventricosus]|uniref:Uncharacterized protein n=1 Tax=Araneus ventricosus TaxID=182803 RepID=A0A4Y2C8J0_ARAVE|nr:hypothetical protein AVEN_176341-1 [Araneus ventricosus]
MSPSFRRSFADGFFETLHNLSHPEQRGYSKVGWYRSLSGYKKQVSNGHTLLHTCSEVKFKATVSPLGTVLPHRHRFDHVHIDSLTTSSISWLYIICLSQCVIDFHAGLKPFLLKVSEHVLKVDFRTVPHFKFLLF